MHRLVRKIGGFSKGLKGIARSVPPLYLSHRHIVRLSESALTVSKNLITRTTAADQWEGADKASFTLTSPDIVESGANKAIEAIDDFPGDFTVNFTLTASGGTDGLYIGVMDTGVALTSGSAHGGMLAAVDSISFTANADQVYAGSTSENTLAVALGSIMRLERNGSTFTLYDDDVLVHTYSATYSGTVRLIVGSGSSFTLDDVTWSFSA